MLNRGAREDDGVEVGRAVDDQVGVLVALAGQLRRRREEHRKVLDAAARPSLEGSVAMFTTRYDSWTRSYQDIFGVNLRLAEIKAF